VCVPGPRVWCAVPGWRGSWDMESRAPGAFTALFLDASLLRSPSPDSVRANDGRGESPSGCWSCLSVPGMSACERKPSDTGMKSNSSGSSAYSSSKTLGLALALALALGLGDEVRLSKLPLSLLFRAMASGGAGLAGLHTP
jgi:hypothetical protein